jgi:serine/threonine protein kinase
MLTPAMTSGDRPLGTPRWQAPELFPDTAHPDITPRRTQATDIYAYALVCYEVSHTRNLPAVWSLNNATDVLWSDSI